MSSSFRRRATFSETDASGRVHFTHFLRWVEEAEHELLKSLAIPVLSEDGGWPRVNVQCDYLQPIVFDDEVEVELCLARMSKSSLHWSFRILKSGKDVAAQGSMVTVCVSKGKASSLSESLVAALERVLENEN